MTSIEQLYAIFQQHPSVTTDTRKITPGSLFFALKGPNFNGNAFAQKALDAGASYAVVDEEAYATSQQFLLVKDVLTALQNLAAYHRAQFNIPVIGITGSNGKTTTKELMHAVLSSQYKTYTTEGNLNNHIGVPLTLLKIQPGAEMAIIEMGANHLHEIESYCHYARPTHGLITNCGKAHLEGFGSVEGVRKGKGELFDYLRTNGGVAFACADFDYFQEMTGGLPEVYWYGTGSGFVSVRGDMNQDRDDKRLEVEGVALEGKSLLGVQMQSGFTSETIQTQLVGSYNIYNVLAAIAVGKFFGVPDDKNKAAIEAYTPGNSRSQLAEKDGNHYILDAYNANPSSMAVAIENFARLKADNKILFLGAMAELGPDSLAEHQAVIKTIDGHLWKNVVLVGGDFKLADHSYRYFDTATDAADWWRQQQDANNYVLVKGSRSTRMEKIYNG